MSTLKPADPDRHAVRPLQIVDGQRPEQHSAAHGFHCARRAGLPVAEDDRDGVPMDIDGDSDARLFTGYTTLMHSFVALGGVCVVDVGLVNPEGVAQYKPVLIAGCRGERAAPPLEVRLVADAAQLGRALDGDDGAHEPD